MARSASNDGVLLIRADAATHIGAGHVMRCLALAQAWRNANGSATFVTAMDAPGIRERLGAEGFETIRLPDDPGGDADANATARLARDVGARWVVVDGYHFGNGYRGRLSATGLRIVCVDDCGDIGPYNVDIVLNQNAYARETMYAQRGATTRLMLGNRYTLLREAFSSWRNRRADTQPVARKLLVTLGAGDADNVTATVIAALASLGRQDLEAVVLVGGANPHRETLCRAARSVSFPVRVEPNQAEVAELMAWADLAISAGGSTCWELAFMGLPGILLVVADNQRRLAESIQAAGAGRNLGWFENVTPPEIADAITELVQDPEGRDAMSAAGPKLIDGKGAARVVEAMRRHGA